MACRTRSVPGSIFANARTAEESSTQLFTPGLGATFFDQLICQRAVARNVSLNRLLKLPDRLVQRKDVQLTFVFIQLDDKRVTDTYSELFPELGRYDDPAALTQSHAYRFHLTPAVLSMPLPGTTLE